VAPRRLNAGDAQGRPAKEGQIGERCALNLAGVSKDEVKRGEWIVSPALHAPTTRIDARLRVLGIEGLRVIDASVMPTMLSANLDAATLMLADKASDLLRGQKLADAEVILASLDLSMPEADG